MSVPAASFPDLDGKVAVVTGGSKGIGAATCERGESIEVALHRADKAMYLDKHADQ